MGVLNVTPDSFSDGGRFLSAADAETQGRRLAQAGCDIIDVGGESTRPGAKVVGVQEELDRVVPVVERLARAALVPISVDTYKAPVARAACAAGAAMINDISGLRFDPSLASVAAESGAALLLGHAPGDPATIHRHQLEAARSEVVRQVADELQRSIDLAVAAGVGWDRILVDPGVGFGKSLAANLILVGAGRELVERLGRPVVVGPSRKSFIGRLTGAAVDDRLPGTIAACTIAVVRGASMVRVHDVSEVKQALIIAGAAWPAS